MAETEPNDTPGHREHGCPCRHLRSKGMYVYTDGQGERPEDDYDSTNYWCFETMKSFGPDDSLVYVRNAVTLRGPATSRCNSAEVDHRRRVRRRPAHPDSPHARASPVFSHRTAANRMTSRECGIELASCMHLASTQAIGTFPRLRRPQAAPASSFAAGSSGWLSRRARHRDQQRKGHERASVGGNP